MELTPEIGHPAPDFNVKDSKGRAISSQLLLGRPYILYFYPQDDTPGCTKEACDLRDYKKEFDQFNTLVIGVSPDSQASHDQFMAKYALNFSLVPDLNHSLSSLFQVWEEKTKFGKVSGGITRTTFIIDAKGIIRWMEKPVQVEGHVQRILKALKDLPKA